MGCWYSEALNGWALLQGFEDTGDPEMLIKGYAGVMSVQANNLPDGMGFGSFRYDPDIFAPWPACTLDNGIGQYGFFKAAKAYVVNDEAFGLVGYGCDVEKDGERLTVRPGDGLKKRVRLVEHGIDVNVSQGEIAQLVYDRSSDSLELCLGDSTGLVHTAEFNVTGIDTEEAKVSFDGKTQITASNGIKATLPMAVASTIRIEW